jgi:hypothetical protein
MAIRSIHLPVAFLALLAGLLGACKTPDNTQRMPRENPHIVTLPGYNFRDSNFTRSDFNVFVITTAYGFDSLLTASITNPLRPSFDKDLVLAIKVETAQHTYKSSFRHMQLNNRVLNVYFTVNRQDPADEGAGWVSISTFPKDRNIRIVRFYFDNVLIRSIPVVLVY